MHSFDEGFSSVEAAARAALESASDLAKVARRLQKAAKDGNITAMKRMQDELVARSTHITRSVSEVASSWPFSTDDEEEYIRTDYLSELHRAALDLGATTYQRDGRLIVQPAIVQVLPADRAVRVDRKKVSTIRPSHLAAILLTNQRRPGGHRAQPFLEALYRVYRELGKTDSSGRLLNGELERTERLSRIYRLFTSLPGTARDYTGTDFARDIYLLQSNGLTHTRSGAVVSFPASTGTRSARDLFTFIGSDGQDVQYYGIRFAPVSR